MDWVKIIVDVLAGLAVVIPLVVKLVEAVRSATKEKNWNALLKMTIEYMETAESKFADGATRKEWVMAMVKTSAVTINYELDEVAMAKISDLIDSICDAADIINSSVGADVMDAHKEVATNGTASEAC